MASFAIRRRLACRSADEAGDRSLPFIELLFDRRDSGDPHVRQVTSASYHQKFASADDAPRSAGRLSLKQGGISTVLTTADDSGC